MGAHYLPIGGKYIILMLGADLYPLHIQTMQDFVTPYPNITTTQDCEHPPPLPLPYEFMCV